MQFPTVTFVAFFGVVLAGNWALIRRPQLRKLWLVSAGGCFYGAWDPRFLGLLASVVVVTWGAGRLAARYVQRPAERWVVALGIAADLALLGVFKYYGFFVDSFTTALGRLGLDAHLPLWQIALPVGISFYVFQSISYLIEIRRRRIDAASLLDVSAWLAFFPTLTSGPIVRASEFVPQLSEPAPLVRADLAGAYWRICRGLVKKLVIASFLASTITDKVFAAPSAYGSVTLLLATYAYAALIYCDFSGYTDLAIGIARLLGFVLPENFDRPYTARSVQDFWSRWHMTLSRWLRDYLYAPLAGRAPTRPLRVYGSLVAVMLIAGLWHGAAWGFVVFGGIHGASMAIERFRRDRRRRRRLPLPARSVRRRIVERVVTFHIVCLAWVFFATRSVHDGVDFLSALVTNWNGPVVLISPLLLLTITAVIALQYLPDRPLERVVTWARGLHPAAQAAAFAMASVPILSLAPTTVPAFIYYRF